MKIPFLNIWITRTDWYWYAEHYKDLYVEYSYKYWDLKTKNKKFRDPKTGRFISKEMAEAIKNEEFGR